MSAKITGYKGNFFGMSKIFFVCLRKYGILGKNFGYVRDSGKNILATFPSPNIFEEKY
jgi:hypothetical protein